MLLQACHSSAWLRGDLDSPFIFWLKPSTSSPPCRLKKMKCCLMAVIEALNKSASLSIHRWVVIRVDTVWLWKQAHKFDFCLWCRFCNEMEFKVFFRFFLMWMIPRCAAILFFSWALLFSILWCGTIHTIRTTSQLRNLEKRVNTRCFFFVSNSEGCEVYEYLNNT